MLILAIVAIAAALCMLLCGCAVVKIDTPKWSARSWTFLKSYELPAFEINSTNGDVVTRGTVRADVDAEAIAKAIGAGLKEAGYGR